MKRALKPSTTTGAKKQQMESDEETELIPGVSRAPMVVDCYYVNHGKGERRNVKGMDEALVLRECYDCIQRMIAQLEPEEERMKRNKDRNGGNAAMERAFAERLRVAFDGLGWECHILNDFTRADVLVRPREGEDDAWYSLQLKTTAEKSVGTNMWHFANVSRYGRMLVVCHALQGPSTDRPCTWVYDGETLSQHLPSGSLGVTPNGVWDNPSKGRLLGKCDGDDLEACARETAQLLIRLLERDDYPRTTMQDAQWTLEKPSHFAEYASLHMLTLRADPSVCILTQPEEQQPHHDLVETCTTTGAVRRLQGKTAHPHWRKADGTASVHATGAGLRVTLVKNIGDRKMGPYAPDDFDDLVVTWRDVVCDKWHVWRIPVAQIPINEATGNLVTGITVHVRMDAPLPPGIDREAVHGPRPRLKDNGRCGDANKSYAWSIQYHESFPMEWVWEPPVPWPTEMEHMRRRKLRLKLRS